MKKVIVLCQPSYFTDSVEKLKAAFPECEVETVSKHGDLKAAIGKGLGFFHKFKHTPDITILHSSGFQVGETTKKGRFYKGIPCATIHYSEVAESKICDDGGCWTLPLSIIREGWAA